MSDDHFTSFPDGFHGHSTSVNLLYDQVSLVAPPSGHLMLMPYDIITLLTVAVISKITSNIKKINHSGKAKKANIVWLLTSDLYIL